MMADDDPALKLATGLLGIPSAEFKKWTIKKQLVTRSEKIVTALSAPAATVVRDSVAKFVYACVWEYLVSVVNESLLGEGGSGVEKAEKFIGVLDICESGFSSSSRNEGGNEGGTRADPRRVFTFHLRFLTDGFEHFKKNSLEQFFINYANEKREFSSFRSAATRTRAHFFSSFLFSPFQFNKRSAFAFFLQPLSTKELDLTRASPSISLV